jgi:hypothetical protein
MEGLKIRKLADKSEGERVIVPVLETVTLRNGEEVQVATGQVKLVNPDTPGTDHEPWPSAGIQLEVAPDEARIPTTTVDRGINEGWIEAENAEFLRRPAGPADNPTRAWHYFMHCTGLTFKTVDGDVYYEVTHNPDKYANNSQVDERGQVVRANEHDDETPVTDEMYRAGETSVDWFYGVKKREVQS